MMWRAAEPDARRWNMTVYDEVEIKVNETQQTATSATASLVDAVRRVMLAGVGAVALTSDEAQNIINKLVDRGEIAQKDGEKLVREVQDRMKTTTTQQTDKVSGQAQNSVESVLNRLNIPSKRDIDELSAKIAQLS